MTYCAKILSVLAGLVLASMGINSYAQSRYGGMVEFDRTVHDFGDIQSGKGPVSCEFKVKNISSREIAIHSVVTSCGCTDVSWTKETLAPGASGVISATYKNDEGAYPFDKTLTAYIDKQVVVLHLRGISHEKEVSLEESFPVHFGALGMRDCLIQAGNMLQGQQKSGEVKVANLGKESISLSFKDVPQGLSLRVSSDIIAPGKTATLTYTVTADRRNWGRTTFYFTPLINGKAYKASVNPGYGKKPAAGSEAIVAEPDERLGNGRSLIGLNVFIKDDFSALTREQRAACPNPMFTSSTYSFGTIGAGKEINASFDCRNIGKSTLHIYKMDSDSRRVNCETVQDIDAGGKGTLRVNIDTAGMPAGEALFIVTLTTNSALRPMVNLYISGFIK